MLSIYLFLSFCCSCVLDIDLHAACFPNRSASGVDGFAAATLQHAYGSSTPVITTTTTNSTAATSHPPMRAFRGASENFLAKLSSVAPQSNLVYFRQEDALFTVLAAMSHMGRLSRSSDDFRNSHVSAGNHLFRLAKTILEVPIVRSVTEDSDMMSLVERLKESALADDFYDVMDDRLQAKRANRTRTLYPIEGHYYRMLQRYRHTPRNACLCLCCGSVAHIHGQGFQHPPQQDQNTLDNIVSLESHAAKCGFGAALYLVLWTTQLLVVRNGIHGYLPSVYLDSRGERDHDMRRGVALRLNENLYAELGRRWFADRLPYEPDVLQFCVRSESCEEH